ncbi:MAG: nuclear transport factor 2 family protein, partial [Chitinophagaceae bacterium]
MKKLALIFLVTFCYVSASHAQLSASRQQSLDNAEKAMFDATSNGDSAAFRKLAGKDYFTINADGSAQTLEEALPNVPRFKGSTYGLSEQKQRVFGDVVLRTGKAKFYFGGQQVAEVLYTAGWVYRNNAWQYIHWQGT